MVPPLRPIGKLGKPWGNQGELTLQLDAATDRDDLDAPGWLFVDIDGQHVPFHYAALREKGGAGTLVRFDDLDDPQRAAFLVGRTILVPAGDTGPRPAPDGIVGLRVHDEVHGDLGEVVALEGTDRNPVMLVRLGEQEVMVPLADELVTGFDPAAGVLQVRTPPGLVEMYRP
ncbi:MAG: hypothetical protein RBT71_08020 [Flavobacteriales bacterium]|jgi:16S rRNA processing protein RimM|nr:hypothetical protein [Flavobacteriales bacterium]